jgi:conjugative transfer region protein TrbK
MDGKTLARIGAVVFVAVAITATAIEMTREEEVPADRFARAVEPVPADPLRAELARCQRLGEAGPRDAACLSAWAENRQRFLAPGTVPTDRLPALPQQAPAGTVTPEDPIRKEMAPMIDEAR